MSMKRTISALLALAACLPLARASDVPMAPGRSLVATVQPSAGVFLYERGFMRGKLFFCSALGCRRLADDVSVEDTSSRGVYAQGARGFEHCSPEGCAPVLATGDRRSRGSADMVAVGVDDDLWVSGADGTWRATPEGGAKVADFGIGRDAISTMWTASGEWISSSGRLSVWCGKTGCVRLQAPEFWFFFDPAPAEVPAPSFVFGVDFNGNHDIWRCARDGSCRDLGRAGRDLSRWAFDAAGNLYLPGDDSDFVCAAGAAACVPSPKGAVAFPRRVGHIPYPVRKPAYGMTTPTDASGVRSVVGGDGAAYFIVGDSYPRPSADKRAPAAVWRREGDAPAAALTFDKPQNCWTWDEGDDEDDAGYLMSCEFLAPPR